MPPFPGTEHPWPHLDPREAPLWLRLRDKDPVARATLVQHHMGLVHHLAARYTHNLPPGHGLQEDLLQAGAIGLIRAIDGFEPNRGFRFATYAVPLILGELRRCLRQQQAHPWSPNLSALARQVDSARQKLAAETGYEPSARAIADFLRVGIDQVVEVQEARRSPSTIAGDVADPAAEPIATTVRRLFVAELLALLPDRTQRLLHLRYWAGQTQQEAAAALNLSQGQVSRLERQALTLLRHHAAPVPTSTGNTDPHRGTPGQPRQP